MASNSTIARNSFDTKVVQANNLMYVSNKHAITQALLQVCRLLPDDVLLEVLKVANLQLKKLIEQAN